MPAEPCCVLNAVVMNESKPATSTAARSGAHVSSLNWEPPLLSSRAPQPPPQRRRPVSPTCSEDADGLPSEGSEGSRAAKSARTALSTDNSRSDVVLGGGGPGGLSVASHQRHHADDSNADEAAAGLRPLKARRSRSEKDLANIGGGGSASMPPLPPALGSHHAPDRSSDNHSSTVLAMFKAQQIGSGPPPIRGGVPAPPSSNLPPMAPPAISRANRLANSTSSSNVGAPAIPSTSPAAPAMPQASPSKQANQRAQQPSPQRGAVGGVATGGTNSPLPPLLPRLGQLSPATAAAAGSIRLGSGSSSARALPDSVAADGEGHEAVDGAGIGIPRSRFLASLARDPVVPNRSSH